MTAPQTTGILRSAIADMQIGDYIQITRDSTIPEYWKVGGGIQEIPYNGVNGGAFTDGDFHYMIKVDKGLLISDRIRQHNISWDSLNSYKLAQGSPVSISGIDSSYGIINRSPTGGVAYADANGNKSLTDPEASYSPYGAFPVSNEWDKYIVNFPTDKIASGYTLEDVFHYDSVGTWCQETPLNEAEHSFNTFTGGSTYRVYRGSHTSAPTNPKLFLFTGSGNSGTWGGFRPVFEYNE